MRYVVTCQAHSCVEKAGMISLVKVRELDVDDDFSLRGPTLQKAIEVYHNFLLQLGVITPIVILTNNNAE